MGEVSNFPENICQSCKKREATLLCDKVLGTRHYCGHPPKNNGKMNEIITCDNKICTKCAVNIDGMDVCPGCLRKIKKVLGGCFE
jgi:hypothetical protein